MVIDVYEKPTGFPPLKYLARPFLRPLGTKGIYRLLSWTIPPAFEMKKALHRVPAIGPRIAALIPIGRMGQPEDIAALAVFLASERSAFMTGQTVHANGGTYMPS